MGNLKLERLLYLWSHSNGTPNLKTVLIIGHTFPEPNTTAAGTRMMQLIKLFHDMGMKLFFGSTATTTEYSEDLKAYGLTIIPLALNSSSFDTLLQTIHPDILVFDRFMTEEQFGWRVREVCPDAITILDTEDLHFLRKARETAFLLGGELDLFTPEAQRELASILRCDLSLIISQAELHLLRNTFGISDEKLMYLPIFIDRIVNDAWPGYEDRRHFVILGNFMHAPNKDAIRWLKTSLWVPIRKRLPMAECHIYGAYLPKEIQSFHNPDTGFLVKGWVAQKDTVLENARVVLAPLRFGAGLKGKVLDGLAHGTPVVTTEIGAEGILGRYPYEGVCDADERDIIEKAVSIYSEKELWERLQKQGLDILKGRFSKHIFEAVFSNKITELIPCLQEHRRKHFLGQILHHESLQSKKYLSKWIELKNKN